MVHPFYRPIHAADPPPDPTVGIGSLGKAIHCECPGWCGGRSSADWLTCRSTCKHCNPPKRRRSSTVQPGPGALDDQ